MGREFFKNSKPSPEMRELALQDYQDVVDLLKQPEFNQAELTSVLERQHQRSKSLQERGRQMMVEYLGTKTPAERAAYADRLAEDGITLEVCPGSNVTLGVYPKWDQHPIQKLRERGVKVTVSTDDPPFFHTTMTR